MTNPHKRYAYGGSAKAQCPICGLVVKYHDLRKDWRGTWVCPDCLDPQHPQERPPKNVVDAIALQHPQPLRDQGLTVVYMKGVHSFSQLGQISAEAV
jgi:hypothetical protein